MIRADATRGGNAIIQEEGTQTNDDCYDVGTLSEEVVTVEKWSQVTDGRDDDLVFELTLTRVQKGELDAIKLPSWRRSIAPRMGHPGVADSMPRLIRFIRNGGELFDSLMLNSSEFNKKGSGALYDTASQNSGSGRPLSLFEKKSGWVKYGSKGHGEAVGVKQLLCSRNILAVVSDDEVCIWFVGHSFFLPPSLPHLNSSIYDCADLVCFGSGFQRLVQF